MLKKFFYICFVFVLIFSVCGGGGSLFFLGGGFFILMMFSILELIGVDFFLSFVDYIVVGLDIMDSMI